MIEFYGERCHVVSLGRRFFPYYMVKTEKMELCRGSALWRGIPVIGCNLISSALCMDKYRAHKLVQAEGIAVPDSVRLTRGMSKETVAKAISHLNYPLFIKPVRSGSSFGIRRVSSETEVRMRWKTRFSMIMKRWRKKRRTALKSDAPSWETTI